MTTSERFRRALDDLGDAVVLPEIFPDRLAKAAAATLVADGLGIGLLNQSFRVPLGASSEPARAAERLQFTLGEGPCLRAAADQKVGCYSETQLRARWPVFFDDLRKRTTFRSLVSVPLRQVEHMSGAIDVYFVGPDDAEGLDREAARHLAELISGAFTGEWPFGPVPAPASWLNSTSAQSRSTIWIAIGILNVGLNVSAPEGLSRLRAYAYARGTTADDVAERLVKQELSADDF